METPELPRGSRTRVDHSAGVPARRGYHPAGLAELREIDDRGLRPAIASHPRWVWTTPPNRLPGYETRNGGQKI